VIIRENPTCLMMFLCRRRLVSILALEAKIHEEGAGQAALLEAGQTRVLSIPHRPYRHDT
jgi:hypothetical protein